MENSDNENLGNFHWEEENSDENRLLVDLSERAEAVIVPETEAETEQLSDSPSSSSSSDEPRPSSSRPLAPGPTTRDFRGMYNSLMQMERALRRKENELPAANRINPLPEIIRDEGVLSQLEKKRSKYRAAVLEAYRSSCRSLNSKWTRRVGSLTQDWHSRFQNADSHLEKAKAVARTYLARETAAAGRSHAKKRKRQEDLDDIPIRKGPRSTPLPSSSSQRTMDSSIIIPPSIPNVTPSVTGKDKGKGKGKSSKSITRTRGSKDAIAIHPPSLMDCSPCLLTRRTPPEAKTKFRRETEMEETEMALADTDVQATDLELEENEDSSSDMTSSFPTLKGTPLPGARKSDGESSQYSGAPLQQRSRPTRSRQRSSAAAAASASGQGDACAFASSTASPSVSSMVMANVVFLLDDSTSNLKKHMGAAITIHIPGTMDQLLKCLQAPEWLPTAHRYVVFTGNMEVGLEKTPLEVIKKKLLAITSSLESKHTKAEIHLMCPIVFNRGTRRFVRRVQPLINDNIVYVLPNYPLLGQRRAKGDKLKLSETEYVRLAKDLTALFG